MDLICEERTSDSPFIERVWRSQNEHADTFTSMAETHWGMVVTRYNGKTTLTVRGPETKPSFAQSPANVEHFGIMFKTGTLMPDLPAKMLMDRCDVVLPDATSQSFWLNGSAWQFPDYDNAETFVNWLVQDGLLLHDPVVESVLNGQMIDMSLRTVQRRFLQATGLTHNTVYQIERARRATTLLKQDIPILDVVDLVGYADQPHLTRALKHYTGQTPAQIISKSRLEKLSFLFKTNPF